MAIVDLIQVDSPKDAGFFAAAQPIYERHGQGHAGPSAPHSCKASIRRSERCWKQILDSIASRSTASTGTRRTAHRSTET